MTFAKKENEENLFHKEIKYIQKGFPLQMSPSYLYYLSRSLEGQCSNNWKVLSYRNSKCNKFKSPLSWIIAYSESYPVVSRQLPNFAGAHRLCLLLPHKNRIGSNEPYASSSQMECEVHRWTKRRRLRLRNCKSINNYCWSKHTPNINEYRWM